MTAILLFILALITLIVTLWNFAKSRKPHLDDIPTQNYKKEVSKEKSSVSLGTTIWRWLFQSERERRRDYYRNVYLKSDAWKRKRFVVLRRDNWRCVYCGAPATQVHHKRYARRNIGKEPIEWLVSICKPCHDAIHR